MVLNRLAYMFGLLPIDPHNMFRTRVHRLCRHSPRSNISPLNFQVEPEPSPQSELIVAVNKSVRLS